MSVILWIAAIIILLIGEAVSVGLTLIWFALGALGGLIAAALGFSPLVQIIVFLVLSALTLALVRPVAKKALLDRVIPTNADQVLGKEAVVTQAIDNLAAEGQVRVAGQVWTARSQSGVTIPVRTRVRILRIEGVKVFVELV